MINPAATGVRIEFRFILLFAFMMVQLAILPIFERSFILGAAGDLAYFSLIFYVLISIRHDRLLWISTALFVLVLASYIALLFKATSQMVLVMLNFCASAFLLSAIATILRFILKKDRITLNGVMGGLCVYLLIGNVFMVLFLNVELLNPGAFDFGPHGSHPDILQLYDLLYYYSFISLLTVGYGDIVPMSHLAQTLTVLEGLIGQFYMVFCVAVLVSLYLSARHSSGDAKRH